MSMESIFAEADAIHRARVIEATFGHLNPKCGVRTKGFIIFARSCYRGSVVVQSEFEGVQSSPVMYDLDHSVLGRDLDDGHVYRYDGELIRYKNGNARLTAGKITKI